MSAAWQKCRVILFAQLIPANDYQKLDKTKQSLTGILFSHRWVNREKKPDAAPSDYRFSCAGEWKQPLNLNMAPMSELFLFPFSEIKMIG